MEADSYQKENFMGDRKNDIHISRNIARLRRKMGLTQTELTVLLLTYSRSASSVWVSPILRRRRAILREI